MGENATMKYTAKVYDKKYKAAELKIIKILNKIETLKLDNSYISQIKVPTKSKIRSKYFDVNFLKDKTHFKALLLIILLCFISGLWWKYNEIQEKSCLLELPSEAKSLFRPPEDCSMCIGIEDVVRVSNISSQTFEEEYAYKAKPIIVTDATAGWKAVNAFDFKFFAEFYRNEKMGKQINDCFYFAYKSGLNSLREVFSMDDKRANLSGHPWYVGWSTCYDDETRKLRAYYNRPYFLPKTAESDMVDWIFMGGPGQGAHMHVDSVRHMSWQAQIRGHKQWQLAPPPECLYQCNWISFTVAPGEILVVDTNRWYHKTNVLPGDISITIGAEYD